MDALHHKIIISFVRTYGIFDAAAKHIVIKQMIWKAKPFEYAASYFKTLFFCHATNIAQDITGNIFIHIIRKDAFAAVVPQIKGSVSFNAFKVCGFICSFAYIYVIETGRFFAIAFPDYAS